MKLKCIVVSWIICIIAMWIIFTFLGSMGDLVIFSLAVILRIDVIMWSIGTGIVIGTIVCWVVNGEAPTKVVPTPTGTGDDGEAPTKVVPTPTGTGDDGEAPTKVVPTPTGTPVDGDGDDDNGD